jgi:GH24 family phage-related lysozyme (muramidase)
MSNWYNPLSWFSNTPPIELQPAYVDPLVAPSQSSLLNQDSINLILTFEVGDATGDYYNRFLANPEWPGDGSGITIMVGVDIGAAYNNKQTFVTDLSPYIQSTLANRLSSAVGITGTSAKNILSQFSDISIDYQTALAFFLQHDVQTTYNETAQAFPGFTDLAANCQGALVSLVFNRGVSMGSSSSPNYPHDTRAEMRTIRDLVPQKDYTNIANQIRSMERIWKGTDNEAGMTRRREGEAQLVESCLQ